MVNKPIRRVIWTRQSIEDMRHILTYFKETVSFDVSEIMEQRLLAAIEGLTKLNTGRPSRMSGLYEKSVTKTHYIIAYRLVGDDILQIIGLIHSSQNWTSQEFP